MDTILDYQSPFVKQYGINNPVLLEEDNVVFKHERDIYGMRGPF